MAEMTSKHPTYSAIRSSSSRLTRQTEMLLHRQQEKLVEAEVSKSNLAKRS
jgi:hypothetical protein